MASKISRHRWVLVSLIFIGLIGTKALLKPGFYSSHDGEHQLIRQYIFDRAIKAGHFPPRFDRQLQNHLGYPLFTFTYQLPFWLGEPFMLAGLGIPDTIKIVFILTYIASGLTMYLFAQERWGRLAGFMAAFLYLWAPYRFLTIFVRASLGEHVAFVFLPLLLWSLNSLTRPRLRIALGAISIAGLLLSHSMFAQISVIPVGLFALARLWQEKHKLVAIRYWLVAVLLGIGLSAFYLIPAVYYRKDIQGLNRTFYAEHFVTLKQLIYSKWGYTFSVFGENDGMSFQVGVAQWLVIAGSTWLLARGLLKNKIHRTALALLIAFVLSVFLMTDPSSKIWEQAVKKWAVIDLPWRFLAITTVTASALGGFVINQLKSKAFKIAVVCSLVAISLYTNRNHLRVNERRDYDRNFFTNFTGTSNSYDEYKPVHTDQTLLQRTSNPPAEFIEGQGEINIIKDQPHRLAVDINAKSDSRVRINTTFFPGWQLYLDSKLYDAASLPKTPTVNLNAGNHHLELIYRQTPLMRWSNAASIVAGGIVMGIIAVNKNKKLKRIVNR